MEQYDHVLVFCYFFPPNDGVGGRRWVKFAGYLLQNNIKITIVTTEIYSRQQSSWKNDLHPSIHIIRLKDRYPRILFSKAESITDKLRYRFAISKIRKKYRGNIFDASSMMEDQINTVVVPYIEQNKIRTVIASGAPFSYFSYTANLKNKIPGLKVILDYRDLWTDSRYHFGGNVLKTQGQERFDIEKQMEEKALVAADRIFVVSRDLEMILSADRPSIKEKITVIPNGYDHRDGEINGTVTSISTLKPLQDKKIVFSYFGTINCGRAYAAKWLSALNEMIRFFEKQCEIEVNFYGNTNIAFEEDVNKLENARLKNCPRVSIAQMKEVAAQSDFLLYIKREDELPNSFATKFYDYLRLRKYIVILSPVGDVTDFIDQNGIGLVLNEHTATEQLKQLVDDYRQGKITFNAALDIEQFSIESITRKMMTLL